MMERQKNKAQKRLILRLCFLNQPYQPEISAGTDLKGKSEAKTQQLEIVIKK
ncbi:hypothetical protein ES703_58764 [subsurface metagenome]